MPPWPLPPTGRRYVCTCEYGTDPALRDPSAAQQYFAQAVAAWQFFENQDAARGMLDPVEVLVPRLMKRVTVTSIEQPAPAPPPGPAWLQPPAHHSFHGSGFDEVRGWAARGASLGTGFGAGQAEERPLGLLQVDPSRLRDTGAAGSGMGRAQSLLTPHDPLAAPHGSSAAGRAHSLPSDLLSTPSAPPLALDHTPVLLRGDAPFASSATAPRLVGMDSRQGGQQPRAASHLSRGQRQKPASKGAAATAAAGQPWVKEMDLPEGYVMRGPSREHPPQPWRLAVGDVTPGLAGKMVQLYWPADGQWWPARVVAVDCKAMGASLVYETGEHETAVLAPLLAAEQVAWLLPEDAARAVAAQAEEAAPPRAHLRRSSGKPSRG